jgi:hypothetical protein
LTDKNTEPSRKPFHYEDGVPVFDVGRVDKLEREQAEAKIRDDEYKREQLSINKWVMRFTGALVLCSVIAGGVSFYQARVAKWNAKAAQDNAVAASDMVAQMRTSGNDTHELAVQARNQANRTKEVADRALAQANATNELAKQAKRSADANKEAADAVTAATQITQQQLSIVKLQQRAYVDFDSTKFREMKVDDLTRLIFQIGVQNVGKVIASNIKLNMVVEVPKATDEPSLNYTQIHIEGIAAPLYPGAPVRWVEASRPASNGYDPELYSRIEKKPDRRQTVRGNFRTRILRRCLWGLVDAILFLSPVFEPGLPGHVVVQCK